MSIAFYILKMNDCNLKLKQHSTEKVSINLTKQIHDLYEKNYKALMI